MFPLSPFSNSASMWRNITWLHTSTFNFRAVFSLVRSAIISFSVVSFHMECFSHHNPSLWTDFRMMLLSTNNDDFLFVSSGSPSRNGRRFLLRQFTRRSPHVSVSHGFPISLNRLVSLNSFRMMRRLFPSMRLHCGAFHTNQFSSTSVCVAFSSIRLNSVSSCHVIHLLCLAISFSSDIFSCKVSCICCSQ